MLAKEQTLPILNVLGLTRPAQAGLELTTSRVLICDDNNTLVEFHEKNGQD
jgi:hypothetical protein